MKRITACLFQSVLMLTVCSEAIAQQVLFRPKTDTLPEQLVANIANNIAAQDVSSVEVKRYVGLSYAEFIKANCGSIQPGYGDIFLSKNNLAATDIDKKITEDTDRLVLPACIYIKQANMDSKPIQYTVQEGDSLSKLHARFTGSGYDPDAISSYFARDENSLNDVKSGQILKLPFVSIPSMVPAQKVSDAFLTTVNEYSESLQVIPPESQIFYGEVITSVSVRGQTSSGAASCAGGGSQYPFDADFLKKIYDFSLKASREPPSKVNVAVVDNGFQGVALAQNGEVMIENERPVLREPFPERSFFTAGDFKLLGPEIRGMSPINYLNSDSPYTEDEVNGHGTHVTGLIFGGFAFYEQFKSLFTPSFSYIKTDIINIGNSKSILPQYSERLLLEGLRMLPEWRLPHIVNISLSYDLLKVDRRPDYVKDDLRDALTLTGFERSLFVVAAGNNGIDISSTNRQLYPAMFGGEVRNNVITVTSHDTDGKLSSFANKGEKHVDIAAPGCEIPSWIKSTLTPTYLSGTSQSAPIVSFTAALYKTMRGATATEIKNRLIYSGDLIKDVAERQLIRSRATLSPLKMLLPHFDYLNAFIDGENKILLGNMARASGFYCDGDQQETAWQGINAFKRSENGAYLYVGDKNDNQLRICEGVLKNQTAAGKENVVAFTAKYELADSEIITLARNQTEKKFYKAGQIIEIVRSEVQ